MIDEKGKLFGKINVLDLLLIFVIIAAIALAGIFFLNRDSIETMVLTEEEANVLNSDVVAPGSIIAVDKKSFTVRCGNGALRIMNLQLEGKKRMDTAAFLLGYKIEVGGMLG